MLIYRHEHAQKIADRIDELMGPDVLPSGFDVANVTSLELGPFSRTKK